MQKLKNGVAYLRSVLFLVVFVSGCSYNPSQPQKNVAISDNQGVLILSTQDDGSTSTFGLSANEAVEAVLSLGLSELERDFMSFSIAEIRFDEITRQPLSGYYNPEKFVHSYRSESEATAKKWHIIPLEAGIYTLHKFGYTESGSVSKYVKLPWGWLQFKVEPNQVVYLGDIKTALKMMVMSRRYGDQLMEMAPMITGIQWRDDEAENVLREFPNLPTHVSRADLNLEELRERFSSAERARQKEIETYNSKLK